jgi:KDO2-lipid IV(A) lauroyltransferase
MNKTSELFAGESTSPTIEAGIYSPRADFPASSPTQERKKKTEERSRAFATMARAKLISLADAMIFCLGRGVIISIQLLPLTWVARLGRLSGTLAYHVDGRHRRIALGNLTSVFGREKSSDEIKAIARENFKRIGENHLSAIKTAAMSFESMRPHVEFTGQENLPQSRPEGKMINAVVGIGHFGNFELYARVVEAIDHDRVATTFRGVKPPALNRLLQSLRGKNGCVFFERRTDGRALRAKLNQGGLILGLLADQSCAGMRAPFMARDCHTGLAPATLALRYNAQLFTAICYRTSLAKWRIDCGKPIPTRINGVPRSSEDIMLDVNRELETAIRRDPANWFWVHRRWKN